MSDILSQSQIDKAAAGLVEQYLSTIFTAPFRQTRVLGLMIQPAWQIERQFITNMQRVNALAQAGGLVAPFDPSKVKEHEAAAEEPSLFAEEGDG